ncbi:DNA-processing protein DprA [Plantibacter sp. CFBP 8804]|uniref:DNA-processing protein DprA n=1 Tax=Plantibacter sp. CFBP 8804 TaxID=2775270 RepID=UPI00177D9E5E|nr:DNA-processing protein DprA [Plantibacter sp. CFBP 8804]
MTTPRDWRASRSPTVTPQAIPPSPNASNDSARSPLPRNSSTPPDNAELAQLIATDIAHTDAAGAVTMIPGDDTWPTALDDLTDAAPFVIWARGNPQHLAAADRITLVGGHEPTRYGRAIANDFAAGLATRSYAICTGTGAGTHQVIATAALAAGGPLIIALPGGIGSAAADVDETVLEQILDGHGCIISEHPPSEPATRLRGMNRNRLLAALTSATIALECGERSDAVQVAGHARVCLLDPPTQPAMIHPDAA